MSQFNVSLLVWAKSQVSVHKPQFLKRKESRSGSNRGPSAVTDEARPFILSQTLWNARNALATHWQAVPDWREGVGKTQGP